MAKKPRQYRYRSAVTGRWVPAAFAARNPDTTVRVLVKPRNTRQ